GRDIYLHLPQPLLIIHGTLVERRMESYTDLPELAGRPDTTVVPLPTGALPHWERPSAVMERISEFYAHVDRSVAQNTAG
ncbi:MAG TPA: hypothetical protein VMN39_06715, partial [Longimicrobiaceae bacterium]|nr:hypothetical protein [Longimicrobiaceae bacterium]